jgi:hypothetical protein
MIGRRRSTAECGKEVYHPSHFLAYRSNRNSQSWDEGSSYDGDRPNSRLTVIQSPCHSHDFDDDLSIADLDSPDFADETNPCSPSEQGRSGSFNCEECMKSFSSPGKLRQHEYSHTGETPFECSVPGCEKKFTSKFKLKRHILIHSQYKTFSCDTCGRAFRRKDHLKNHEKVHDPGKTIYSCSYDSCPRTYNSISSFKKHQAMHSAEDGQLDCKICKIVLENQDELMNHLKIHTGSRAAKGMVDKKFGCTQCERKFFTKKDLKRHSVVHTGNREFSCPHCSQRFGRKDHMTRHAKKTHQQFYDPEQLRLVAPTKAEGARGSRSERSVSDPGPAPLPRFSPEKYIPVTSPNTVVFDFQKLGTHDDSDPSSTLSYSYLLSQESDYSPVGDGKSSVYTPPEILLRSDISGLNPVDQQLFILPDKMNPKISENQVQMANQSQMHSYDIKPSLQALDIKYADIPKLIPIEPNSLKKIETYSEDSNSAENAMKELLEEKDNIDFDSFISEIDNDIFQKKPLIVSPVEYCEIKVEPRSRPCSPERTVSMMTFPRVDPLPEFCSSLETKPVPKPIFIRTQSQDSLTRTKNPVLPSIHFEGSLVVPEPKQVRYSSQDPFTLDYEDEEEGKRRRTKQRSTSSRSSKEVCS